MTDVLKYAERKCIGQIVSLQILTLEKCTTVERMDGCEYSKKQV